MKVMAAAASAAARRFNDAFMGFVMSFVVPGYQINSDHPRWGVGMEQRRIQSASARLRAEPLTALQFAPFGDVLRNDDGATRRKFYPDATRTGDGAGELRFSVSRVEPVPEPLSIVRLERHPFAAQTFIPLEVSRWVVIVAPDLPDGSPDIARLRAFIAAPGTGVSYRRGTWHHGTTVLDATAQFGVVMWRRTTHDDDEFYDLETPIEIDVARNI